MASVFRDFPALIARLRIEPNHLIHVGAHQGEEMPFYQEAAVERITLVEPIPALADALREKFPSVDVLNLACGPEAGEALLNVMSRTNLSTLLAPGPKDQVVDFLKVRVAPLRDIQGDANIAVIDAQGLELDVLKSADLDKFDLVFVETCTVDDPTIAAPHDATVAYMEEHGLVPANVWSRDYKWISDWGRGRNSTNKSGYVHDVAFVKGA